MNKQFLHTIYKYLNDKLSNKERNDLEREINADPFLQDAMDGFEQLSANDLESDIKKLEHNLSKKSAKKTIKLQHYLSIAASIILLMGIVSILYYLNSNSIIKPELAENKTIENSKKHAPLKEKQKQEIIIPAMEEELIESNEPLEYNSNAAETKNITSNKKTSTKKRSHSKAESIREKPEPDVKESTLAFEDFELEVLDDNEINEEELMAVQSAVPDNKQNSIAFSSSSSSSSSYSAPLMIKTNPEIEINSIKGKILDENHLPLPGASIMITNKNEGIITDMDGNFSIKADSMETLTIAFIGYEEVKISVNELKEQNNTIALEPDMVALSEVVVVGYQTQRKKQNTGAVTRMSSNNPPEYIPEPTTYKARKIQFNCISQVDTCATPLGGKKELRKYIKNNFEFEADSTLTMEAAFVVELDGTLSEIEITSSPNEAYSDELIRVLSNAPDWTPSIDKNQKVRSEVSFRVIFK